MSLSGRGTSKSSVSLRTRSKGIFEEWRSASTEATAHCPAEWDKLPATILCACAVYNMFAHFVAKDYLIKDGVGVGKHLALKTALGYLCCLVNLASDKFKATGDARVQVFFTCLDARASTRTPEAVWFRGLKINIVRICFQRARDDGEELDKSAVPLYLAHVRSMMRALFLEGSAEVRARLPNPRHIACSLTCRVLCGVQSMKRALPVLE